VPEQRSQRRRLALVLSGGGARGAYEAGALSWLLDELPRRLGHPVHFDIVTGTSVGAVHACWVAANEERPRAGQELLDTWRGLSVEQVFGVGPSDLVRLPLQLLGMRGGPKVQRTPARLPGLFDTTWLEAIVAKRVHWEAVRARLGRGALDALAVTATEIATGRSIVFVDAAADRLADWPVDPFVVARRARIGLPHALASAAIPLVFPAVRIGQTYYCDGGLRLNTPLAPAVRLGADAVLVIGLRHSAAADPDPELARAREVSYANPLSLAGRALNALLLDRVEADLRQLRLINGILRTGTRVYGAEFLGHINESVVAERGTPYRIVDSFLLQPSRDLGVLAGECLRHHGPTHGVRDWIGRSVMRYAGGGLLDEADLLSYLLFDRCYTDHLTALGRSDAAAAADALATFVERAMSAL
jgi:NTE family protein